VTIGDVVVPKVEQGAPRTDFTYIDIGSVNNKTKQIESAKDMVAGSKVPSRAQQHVQPGDILVSMTRPNLNAVAKVSTEMAGAICSTGFDVLRSIEVEPDWLFLIVKSRPFIDTMTALVQGALYPAVRPADIRVYEFPLPPLAEQRRIVAKIEALQERSRRAREALSEVGPLLEQFRQSVLAAAFRGDLTADWRAAHPHVEPASALLQRIRAERRHRWEQAELAKYAAKGQKPPKNWQEKYQDPEPIDDSDLPDLPDSWCWVSLDNLLAEPLANGRSVKDGNGFPVLRLTALKNRQIDLSEHKLGAWSATDAMRFIVQKGDFLVSRGNGSIALVGRGGLVIDEPHIQVAYPDTLIRVRVTSRFGRDFLALFWDSVIVRQQIETAAHTTAGIHKVSQLDLQQIMIPLPPLKEQREIVRQATDHLNGIERLASEASEALKAFNQLDQSILAKAFRGELVPQDPNDEPASVLLERVRAHRVHKQHIAGRGPSVRQ
jgi:type I restriction enzyme S subunit